MLEAKYTENLDAFVLTGEAREFSYLKRALGAMTETACGRISHGAVIEMRKFLEMLETTQDYVLVANGAPESKERILPKRNLHFRVTLPPVGAIILFAIVEEIGRLSRETFATAMIREVFGEALRAVVTPLRHARLMRVVTDPRRHVRAYLPQFTRFVDADFARVERGRDEALTRAVYRVLVPKREYEVFFSRALAVSVETGIPVEEVDIRRVIIERNHNSSASKVRTK